MFCGVCRAVCAAPIQHPCFASGDLGALLVCGACMPRFVGYWELSDAGKHQWCRVCAAQTDVVGELRDVVGLRKAERRVLKRERELDANGAALYTCDVCPEAFCSVCIMRLFSLGAVLEAKATDHWACPVCTGAAMLPLQHRGAVIPPSFPSE